MARQQQTHAAQFRKPINFTTTSTSPRRSQWNELLQQQPTTHGKLLTTANVATLLPTSRTSSLRRSKIQSLYAKRYSPNSNLDKSLYGTIDHNGHYRSPSRILFDSGYLTLGNNHQSSHIYENLYNNPTSSPSGHTTSVKSNDPDSTIPVASSSTDAPKTFLRDNLRDSVQLKGSSSRRDRDSTYGKTTSIFSTTVEQHHTSLSPHKTPPHAHHPNHFHHHRHNSHEVASSHEDVIDHSIRREEDSPSYMDKSMGKYSQKHHSEQLNHHIIQMKDTHASSSKASKGAIKSSPETKKKRKKKKPRREWFWEDPQKRLQFIQSTLIICNVIAIFLGVTGLILAGFVDHRPIYRLDTLGGQLCLVSVYTILTSLAGLYGARRESVTLLVIYGSMILAALAIRSLSAFVTSLVSANVSVAASMAAAFLEIILILFAFALAADVRLKKLEKNHEKERQKDSASPFTESSGNNDNSSSASTSSSSSSPPSTSCDREALRV